MNAALRLPALAGTGVLVAAHVAPSPAAAADRVGTVSRFQCSPWRTDTTEATATFDPQRSGTWRIRARTTEAGVGTTPWSPVRRVKVA